MDGWMDGCMDGGMDGWMDGGRDGGMDFTTLRNGPAPDRFGTKRSDVFLCVTGRVRDMFFEASLVVLAHFFEKF